MVTSGGGAQAGDGAGGGGGGPRSSPMSRIENPLAAPHSPSAHRPRFALAGVATPAAAHPHVASTLPTPVATDPTWRGDGGAVRTSSREEGRHAQPVHRFALLSISTCSRACRRAFSVTFGSRLPLLGFALALNIHTLALNPHAAALHARGPCATLLALAIEIHALVVRALAIHTFTVLALAIFRSRSICVRDLPCLARAAWSRSSSRSAHAGSAVQVRLG